MSSTIRAVDGSHSQRLAAMVTYRAHSCQIKFPILYELKGRLGALERLKNKEETLNAVLLRDQEFYRGQGGDLLRTSGRTRQEPVVPASSTRPTEKNWKGGKERVHATVRKGSRVQVL